MHAAPPMAHSFPAHRALCPGATLVRSASSCQWGCQRTAHGSPGWRTVPWTNTRPCTLPPFGTGTCVLMCMRAGFHTQRSFQGWPVCAEMVLCIPGRGVVQSSSFHHQLGFSVYACPRVTSTHARFFSQSNIVCKGLVRTLQCA